MIVQTPDFKASAELNDFVTKNVEKLEAASDRILEAHVVLKVEKSETGRNKVCELKLVVAGNDAFATRNSETFEEAVMQAIDAVKHQLLRRKESVSEKQQRGLPVVPDEN